MRNWIAMVLCALLVTVQVLPVALADELTSVPEPGEEVNYVEQAYVISAYYSPLPGQDRYATGSYERDIRLNGNGTNGADGTEVYPGMIACPSNMYFGTNLYIPGIGQTTCHDRGGAIVAADGVDSRGYEFDRLDVWMGHGDEGLTRALQWGKRTVYGVLNYGVSGMDDQVYLAGYTAAEAFVQTVFISPLHFKQDIFYGSDGDSVTDMQNYLVDWGYLEEASGFYGDETENAIYQFQLDFDIVDSEAELGAGHFGISTRSHFDTLIKDEESAAALLKKQKGEALMAKYVDLQDDNTQFARSLGLGAKGGDVTRLQEELVKLGFLRIEPTGYFGETTEHAVFKFQQAQGIVSDKGQLGAGHVGPTTRATLNALLNNRYDMKTELAFQREEVAEGRHIVLTPQEPLALRDED